MTGKLVLAVVLVAGAGAAGCGETAPQTGIVSSSLTSPLRSEVAVPSTTTTVEEDEVGVSIGEPSGSQVEVEIPGVGTDQGPDGYNPAEYDPVVGEPPVPMLVFDDEGAYRLDAGGFTRLVDGPVAELADDGDGGVLFQRDRQEAIIWWLAEGSPGARDVLVTVDASHLVLEGVTGTGPDREVVYQRVTVGDPDSTVTTLRAYRFDQGTVREVAVTGGWEAVTFISPVTGGEAAGRWVAEAYGGLFLYDLEADRPVLGPSVGDGGELEPDRSMVAANGDELIDVGTMRGDDGLVSQMGLVRLDRSGAELGTIATYPWDNGYWYASSIFVHDGHAVVSRTSAPDDILEPSEPLGPIVVDLATGDSVTLPFAGHARPLAAG